MNMSKTIQVNGILFISTLLIFLSFCEKDQIKTGCLWDEVDCVSYKIESMSNVYHDDGTRKDQMVLYTTIRVTTDIIIEKKRYII